MTQKQATAPKSAALAGIVFSVLLTFSLVTILTSVPSNLADNGVWLTSKGNILLMALNLVPFAGIAFLWFMGVVRDHLGENEDRFIATVFLGSGLLFLAMLFVLAATTGSVVFLYTTQTNRFVGSGYYNFGVTIVHEILNAYMLKMAGVFMISTSTLLIRTRLIPQWMAFLGYGLAFSMLIRISHIDRLVWISLAFPLWIFLISLYILIDNYRRQLKSSLP